MEKKPTIDKNEAPADHPVPKEVFSGM